MCNIGILLLYRISRSNNNSIFYSVHHNITTAKSRENLFGSPMWTVRARRQPRCRPIIAIMLLNLENLYQTSRYPVLLCQLFQSRSKTLAFSPSLLRLGLGPSHSPLSAPCSCINYLAGFFAKMLCSSCECGGGETHCK